MGRPRARRSFMLSRQKKDSIFVALGKNEKGEKYLSCSMHYSQKLASFEFSKAQIVVNDSKLPQGLEISTVWGSFSFSNISNGFISEGPVTMQSPLWTNGWIISILNKIIANLFSSSVGEKRLTERDKSRQRQMDRRQNDGLVRAQWVGFIKIIWYIKHIWVSKESFARKGHYYVQWITPTLFTFSVIRFFKWKMMLETCWSNAWRGSCMSNLQPTVIYWNIFCKCE